MSFKEGNQYGKMSKRGEGKITKEVKSKLTDLMDNIIDDIDVEMLTTAQKFKLLDMCLQYSIPKMVYKQEIKAITENEPKQFEVQVVDSKELKEKLDEYEQWKQSEEHILKNVQFAKDDQEAI